MFYLIFIPGFFSQENSQCLKIKLPELRKKRWWRSPRINYEQKIKTDSEKEIHITVVCYYWVWYPFLWISLYVLNNNKRNKSSQCLAINKSLCRSYKKIIVTFIIYSKTSYILSRPNKILKNQPLWICQTRIPILI